jgi:UDP-GlcNAc:undecaprenyl-phosphate/decaprenyl-phosphate GlcNAc-1-phosphate transferase
VFFIYEYFIAFILAFIVAFSATPMVKKIAFQIGAVDVPRDSRRMHKKPMARIGGLAIFFGFLVSVLFDIAGRLFSVPTVFSLDDQMLGLIIGILIIVATGIIDDIYQIKARYKLVPQLAAAIIVVVAGTRVTYVTNPFAELGLSLMPEYISIPLTVLWIVGITNAINFIDGLDGLAAGVSSIASLSLFFISVIRGELEIAVLTAALAGATLGFLPYNFNPAKIFMGDTGAMFLGFTLGAISVQGTLKSYTAIAIAIPLLVLALPLFDTIFAIIRRVFQGKSIMEADRGHLHHRLIDMGLSHKQSVVVMYTASAALGLCAVVLADRGVLSAIILVISVSIFIIAGARYMSEMGDDPEESGEPLSTGVIDENLVEQESTNSESGDTAGNDTLSTGVPELNLDNNEGVK